LYLLANFGSFVYLSISSTASASLSLIMSPPIRCFHSTTLPQPGRAAYTPVSWSTRKYFLLKRAHPRDREVFLPNSNDFTWHVLKLLASAPPAAHPPTA
jgi:hypothetical protein